MRAKKIADYILTKEQNIRVDVPLSVYVDTFLVLGAERGIDGAEAFIQHALNTKYLKDNINTVQEFPDIPKQVGRILDEILITEEAKRIAGDIK